MHKTACRESDTSMMDLCQIQVERCKGCELCVAFCPQLALAMSEDRNASGYHPAYLQHPDQCNGCALCAEMCPEICMTIYRKRKNREPQPSLD